jgi:hypothetical protein
MEVTLDRARDKDIVNSMLGVRIRMSPNGLILQGSRQKMATSKEELYIFILCAKCYNDTGFAINFSDDGEIYLHIFQIDAKNHPRFSSNSLNVDEIL